MWTRTLLVCACALLAGPFRGQYTLLDLPRESQHATVTQRLGITDITVDHSRPSVKGRTIWGDVVPYGQVWRAGANENTTITFAHDARVEGQAVPAGTYGLHMIPTPTTWTVILSKDHTAWGSFFYTPEKDAVRATVTPRPCPLTEQVTYTFTDVTDSTTTLVMRWEKLEVPVRLGVDVHGIILAGLDDQLRGLTAFGWEAWYEAAKYCQLEKIAPDRAMAWVDRSIALRPNFENRTLKADLLTEQGRTAEAEAIRQRMVAEATNGELNTYAYALLNQGKKAEAVKLFELNAKRHPDDPNVFDSLGEGYMTNGQPGAAIKSFKKSLSMYPPAGVKANSLKCLRRLGVDTSAWEAEKD
ncbi:MAG: DUF2911 domain-containing protein [Bacteroidetes bacterium]|nr:DUF2911 domain-containing protein [Bacteroidota bacterium]